MFEPGWPICQATAGQAATAATAVAAMMFMTNLLTPEGTGTAVQAANQTTPLPDG